jgi:catechol-2,3-dioxygenase
MAAMKAFYGKTLDLRLLDVKDTSFAVEAGESRITFISSTETAGGRAPFYHFAFNIPENKILKALEWQAARTPLLPIPERNRAAGYPPEVVDYSHWNAHSIFFLDPAGNVVEYIARHDLKNGDTGSFGWPDILYVSELALVVDEVPAMAETVKKAAVLTQYQGGDSDFTALGDEYGLLLLMKKGRVVDFTGNAANGVRVYPTSVNVRGAKAAAHQLAPYPYRLNIEERCACG